jgi:hypothetical protein
MDIVNFTNVVLYLAIGALAVLLCRRGAWVLAVPLLALTLHGLAFNVVYLYRDLAWATCPPQCGLQEWSPILRLHGLLAIITCAVARLKLEAA